MLKYKDRFLCVPSNKVYSRIQDLFDKAINLDDAVPIRAKNEFRYEWLLEDIEGKEHILELLYKEGFFVKKDVIEKQIIFKETQEELLKNATLLDNIIGEMH